jgi:hypothetical protein
MEKVKEIKNSYVSVLEKIRTTNSVKTPVYEIILERLLKKDKVINK